MNRSVNLHQTSGYVKNNSNFEMERFQFRKANNKKVINEKNHLPLIHSMCKVFASQFIALYLL